MSGRLIVVCGIDGSGKSTQEDTIVEVLAGAGIGYHRTQQPTTWYRSNPLVRTFLDRGESPCSVDTIALIAAADRMIHVETEIRPALQRGDWVVSNRYVYSTYAYFSARGANTDFVHAINSRVPVPDFGILLTIDPGEAVSRVRTRDQGKVKFEERDPMYLNRVQDELLRVWPASFLTVDGNLPRSEVTKRVRTYIESAIEAHDESPIQ